MWRPDRTVAGPDLVDVRDIDQLNRLFSDAFTDRYRKDGLSGVRVPYLNAAIWRYAIADAGAGAMLWRDGRGEMIAFNIVHRSGTEGWMGPLAVRPDRQGEGLGRRVVMAGVEWLEAEGARTIGLETMPRTIENIGFYSRLGFVPAPLTITLQRDQPRPHGPPAALLSTVADAAREQAIAECRVLADRVATGVDFTRELELTLEMRLGDATLLRDAAGALQAFALWHTAPLAHGHGVQDLRILKLVALDTATALATVAAVEREAAGMRLSHCSVRCQTRYSEFYAALVSDDYRVQWTDLRLNRVTHPEPVPAGIWLSNWEI
ncbi:MAG: GNAT family N-acetyltransferase [Gemmatimonadota bacterium]